MKTKLTKQIDPHTNWENIAKSKQSIGVGVQFVCHYLLADSLKEDGMRGCALKILPIGLIMLFVLFIGGEVMALELKSPAFKDGEFIPKKYTCQGEDVSVPLEWIDVPGQTQSFALICDDPDAPAKVWVHWIIYDIPADKAGFSEDIGNVEVLEDGSKQGLNDSADLGYGGPCPPPGRAHRYIFKLYCLDSMLNLKPGLMKEELLEAMAGHIIQEAQLTGLYQR